MKEKCASYNSENSQLFINKHTPTDTRPPPAREQSREQLAHRSGGRSGSVAAVDTRYDDM